MTMSFVNLLHEVGMLAKIPRSGFAFLGSGKQSVAEHSFRMTLTAYVLAQMVGDKKIDKYKLLMMCLLHDLPEARTGDLNYVNKKYVRADEAKVIEEMGAAYACGPEIQALMEEYIDGESLEAQLAHDADQLELMFVLKQEHEKGNSRAMDWLKNCAMRLQTEAAKQLAQDLQSTPSDAWWYPNPSQ